MLAEDDDELRKLLTFAFQAGGYDVIECRNGMELLKRLGPYLDHEAAKTCDLIVSDIRMPGLTGLEVFEGLYDSEGFPPMILITAFGDAETHLLAKKLGVAAMFDKPFEIADLIAKANEITAPQRTDT